MKKKIEYPKHIEKYIKSADKIAKEEPYIKKAFLAPDVVLKMLMGDKLYKNILEKSKGVFKLVTSDFALYEAISCITKEELDLNLLKEFLYKVEIIPSPKIKIDMDRIDHLRGLE